MDLAVAAKNLTPEALRRIAAFDGTAIAKQVSSRAYDAALLEKTLSFAEKFKENGTGLSGMLETMQRMEPGKQMEVADILMEKQNAGFMARISNSETGQAVVCLAEMAGGMKFLREVAGNLGENFQGVLKVLSEKSYLDFGNRQHYGLAKAVILGSRENLTIGALKDLKVLVQRFYKDQAGMNMLDNYVKELSKKSRDNQISEGLSAATSLLQKTGSATERWTAFRIMEKQMGMKIDGLPELSMQEMEAAYGSTGNLAVKAYLGLELGKSGAELMEIFEKSQSETEYLALLQV